MTAESDKEKIARRFGRMASVYEGVTPIQCSMGNELLDLAIDSLGTRDIRHILELGCGTGRLTRKLIKTFTDARVVAIDLCPEMVTQAAHKLKSDRLELFVADAEEAVVDAEGVYDLIISNATVQWFADPKATLPACCSLLKPGGILAYSTFGPDTFRELQESFDCAYEQAGKEPSSHTVPLLSSGAHGSILPRVRISERTFTQTYEDVRSFLKTIQQTGAAFIPESAHTLSRDVYQRMTEHYTTNFSAAAGGITATYHAIYAIADSTA
jgi:malonyl-CoA O-methyltransferase